MISCGELTALGEIPKTKDVSALINFTHFKLVGVASASKHEKLAQGVWKKCNSLKMPKRCKQRMAEDSWVGKYTLGQRREFKQLNSFSN